MDAVSTLARLLLAGVFVLAAVGKARDPRGTREALEGFGIGALAARAATPALPAAELLIAAGLLLTATARVAGAAAAALLLVFCVGIERAVRAGRTPECNCFGQMHSEPVSRRMIVRNLALAALGAMVASAEATTIPEWVDARAAVEIAAMVEGAAILWLITAVRSARHHAPGPAAAAPPAPLSPTVLVRDDGRARPLIELLALDRPTVLVFVEPNCGPCLEIIPDLLRWREVLAERLALLMIAPTDAARAELLSDHGASTVVADPERQAWDAFGVSATPTAVVIRPDGTPATAAAMGPLAIEATVRNALDARPLGAPLARP